MSTHNTHYATKTDKVIPTSGLTFFSICYPLGDGNYQWLCHNRRLSFHCSFASRFSSFEDSKSFVENDFNSGRCEIVVFCFSTTSGRYFLSHSYTCLGGRSEWCAGHFEI